MPVMMVHLKSSSNSKTLSTLTEDNLSTNICLIHHRLWSIDWSCCCDWNGNWWAGQSAPSISPIQSITQLIEIIELTNCIDFILGFYRSRKSCVLYTSAKMKMSNFEILSFMSPKSGDLTLTVIIQFILFYFNCNHSWFVAVAFTVLNSNCRINGL